MHPELLVVEDDHAGVISGVDLHSIGAQNRRWALVASISKAIGPDLRVAGLFADDETVSRVEGRQGVGPGWVSHLVQRLAADLIVEGTSTGMFDQVAATYAIRRDHFVRALASEGVVVSAPSGLNVWVELPDPAAAVAACLDGGYAIRSGDGFVIGDRRGVRVTTAQMDEVDAATVARLIGSTARPARRNTRAG